MMQGMAAEISGISEVSLWHSAWRWWAEVAERDGRFAATGRLIGALAEFARDSTPERRRRRFGDAEFDWEHRVNTTSGGVGWRDRLLGVFNSPYQPTEASLFHEMIEAVAALPKFSFGAFTFIDLGSGKGRTLLMAAEYPFRQVVGVELLPRLNEIARQNLAESKTGSRKCFAIESICGDAVDFVFPNEPTVLFLFNPFPEAGLRRVIANLEESLRRYPRVAYVLYHNPLLERVLAESVMLGRAGGTEQNALYVSRQVTMSSGSCGGRA
jgi:SAM-dependent methyltransferase